jgi:FkbM family methyltransferase
VRLQEFERSTAPTTLVWADGPAIRLVPGEQLSRALYVSGTYEPNTLCVLRRYLREGSVFLDVGAHAGVMSLAASRWLGGTGRVYAFEPSLREYRRLLESVDLSHVSNITAVRAAVGATSGRGRLRVADAPHSGLNTLGDRFAYSSVSESSRESAEIVTLDDFVRRRGISRIDVIKLDIEGGETAALEGAMQVLRCARPVIVVEVNASALDASGTRPSDIDELLLAADYRGFAINEADSSLMPVARIAELDEQNVVVLPREVASESF